MTYWHAGNASSKTEGLADLFVRCCRGHTSMDGRLMVRRGPEWVREWDRRQPGAPQDESEPYPIALPGLRNGEPWRQWVLVQSYDQAKDSSMRAYKKLVGRHPHDISYLYKGVIKRLRIKPDGWESDDPESWSEVTFISQEGMTEEDVQRVQGARIHGVHCDEMPLQSIFFELLNRAEANVPLLVGISATPEYKPEWEWAYGSPTSYFQDCYGTPKAGRVRIQSSVEDNRALSLKDLHGRYNRNHGGSLFKARWDGEHVDVSGACPFPTKPMQRMLEQCQAGRLETIELRGDPKSELEPDYRDILPAKAVIERWLLPERGHYYLITSDPSRGIDDGDHDPCELEVWDWTEPACVCRFGMRNGSGGFLDEDSLAILADKLGREYNNALIDGEVNGGFGVQFFLTLRKLRYPNLSHDDKTVSPGVISTQYGWNANATTNGEIVNALLTGLAEDRFLCWSADMVRQWMDVREAADGRTPTVSRKARHHREAMICAGRALHWILSKNPKRIREPNAPTEFDAVLNRDMGRPVRKIPGKARQKLEIFRGVPE